MCWCGGGDQGDGGLGLPGWSVADPRLPRRAAAGRLPAAGRGGAALRSDPAARRPTRCRAPAGHPLLIDLLKTQAQRGAWRAAICAAPALVLAHHDLIGSALVTGYPGTEDALGDAYRDQAVVVDEANKLITSKGPGTAMLFGLAAVAALQGDAVADQVAAGLLVSRH